MVAVKGLNWFSFLSQSDARLLSRENHDVSSVKVVAGPGFGVCHPSAVGRAPPKGANQDGCGPGIWPLQPGSGLNGKLDGLSLSVVASPGFGVRQEKLMMSSG